MPDWLAGWIAAVQELEAWSAPWAEVSRPAVVGWTAFYVAFLVYAVTNTSGFLFIDSANLVVHEVAIFFLDGSDGGSTCGAERFSNEPFPFYWRHIFSSSARRQALRSLFFSSRTGSIPPPTWPTRGPWFCR